MFLYYIYSKRKDFYYLDMANIEKNIKIKETYAATMLKRTSQVCRVFTVKVQHNHLNKLQKQQLKMMFVEAKWMYNYILNLSQDENIDVFKLKYSDLNSITHLDKDKNVIEVNLQYLSSQMKQSVFESILTNIKNLSKAKEKGLKTGKLKFISEYTSINLKQANVTHKIISKNRVKLQGMKKPLRVNGLKQILSLKNYDLANAKLIQKCNDYYIAFTVYTEKEIKDKPKKIIGIDLGCQTSVTLSDGRKFHCRVEESEYCKNLRRKMNRCEKGSSNKYKLRKKYIKANAKSINRKNDFAKQLNHILKEYIVIMQDEQISQWKRYRHGKSVQFGILGRIKSLLKENENTIVLSKWFPTTKLCTCCGEKVQLKLHDRTFICPVCGHKEDRDVHAARNMIWLYENIPCVERIQAFAEVKKCLDVIFPSNS